MVREHRFLRIKETDFRFSHDWAELFTALPALTHPCHDATRLILRLLCSYSEAEDVIDVPKSLRSSLAVSYGPSPFIIFSTI